jgi:hypothetical protein
VLRFILHTNILGLGLRFILRTNDLGLGLSFILHTNILGLGLGFILHTKQLGFRVSFHSPHKYLGGFPMAGSGHHHLYDMSFDESRSNMKSIKSAQHTLGFRVVSTQQLFGIFKPTVGATALFFTMKSTSLLLG